MNIRLARALRKPVFSMCLLLFAATVFAQGPAPVPSVAPETTILRYLEQGGLAAVLIVVLWSYRRDLARLLADEKEKTRLLMELIERNTAAQVKLADAVNNCPINGAH